MNLLERIYLQFNLLKYRAAMSQLNKLPENTELINHRRQELIHEAGKADQQIRKLTLRAS